MQNPYFFLYATLTDASGEVDLHFINGNKTTAGSVVQSLHKLKDLDNSGKIVLAIFNESMCVTHLSLSHSLLDGGFFIFSDISVRLEGIYRLKFTLFGIEG